MKGRFYMLMFFAVWIIFCRQLKWDTASNTYISGSLRCKSRGKKITSKVCTFWIFWTCFKFIRIRLPVLLLLDLEECSRCVCLTLIQRIFYIAAGPISILCIPVIVQRVIFYFISYIYIYTHMNEQASEMQFSPPLQFFSCSKKCECSKLTLDTNFHKFTY